MSSTENLDFQDFGNYNEDGTSSSNSATNPAIFTQNTNQLMDDEMKIISDDPLNPLLVLKKDGLDNDGSSPASSIKDQGIASENSKKVLIPWTIEFFSVFFDVTTRDVGKRLLGALMFFKPGFLDDIKENPDLWGPFWIVTTFVIVLVISSNLGSFFNWKVAFDFSTDANNPVKKPTSLKEWTNDFSIFSVSCVSSYGFWSVMPIALWGAMKYLAVPVSILQTICAFGYSCFLLIPFLLLCVINNEWVRWISILFGFFLVSVFLTISFGYEWLKALDSKHKVWILGLVGFIFGTHFVFALFIKLFFFYFNH